MSHDIEHIMEETLAVTESDSSSVVVNWWLGGGSGEGEGAAQ